MRQLVWAEENCTRCGIGIGDSFVRQVPIGILAVHGSQDLAAGEFLPSLNAPQEMGAADCGGETSRNDGT